jgi:hypothetical protein
MNIAARLDDIGKPAWIALTVLGFILFWPIGLAMLAYLIWSGRMSCWRHGGYGRRYDESRERMRRWWQSEREGSGNRAFDEYRAETLQRLEEEQREFRDFLDRLRHAKDKAEFDQFMAERRRPRDEPPPAAPTPQPQPS